MSQTGHLAKMCAFFASYKNISLIRLGPCIDDLVDEFQHHSYISDGHSIWQCTNCTNTFFVSKHDDFFKVLQ